MLSFSLLEEKRNYSDNMIRSSIRPGDEVLIVLKKDQMTGKLTKGIVKDLLTKSPNHHRGIKVRLEDGQVGRVQKILNHKEVDFEKKIHNLVFEKLFRDIPFCLVTNDYVFYQNTKTPEPAVENIYKNILKNRKQFNFEGINSLNGTLPNKKIDLSEIKEKIKSLEKYLNENNISFFIVSKGISMTRNSNSESVRFARKMQIEWEGKNGFDPDHSWDE